MTSIVAAFEEDFKRSPENALKELIWFNELGSIQLSVNGVLSVFSEIEAALIFLLDKSFRPMKAVQLTEVLQA